MLLFKGTETVYKVFEREIFPRLKQPEQSKQSSGDDKYTSFKLDNNLTVLSKNSRNTSSKIDDDLSTSSNASHISFSCGS